jgi:NAD-dependent deacetylase
MPGVVAQVAATIAFCSTIVLNRARRLTTASHNRRYLDGGSIGWMGFSRVRPERCPVDLRTDQVLERHEAGWLGRGRSGMKPGRIVVLTGAEISAKSGLPTFRGADGLWLGWRLEEVATAEAFARQPGVVQRFYDMRRRQLLGAEVTPNAAHRALADLERRWAGPVLIVTQNIDDLHERAGSGSLIHMHGELLKARCTACAAVCAWRGDLAVAHRCPACGESDPLRPHVVWFGEMPLQLDTIYEALGACDLAVGTSGPGPSGRGLRRGGAPPRPGAHRRAQPRAQRRGQPVRRASLRAGERNRASLRRRAPRYVGLGAGSSWPGRLRVPARAPGGRSGVHDRG